MILPSSYIIEARINNPNLNGYTIYVDAGHGGKDNGANNGHVLEDTINLSISKLLVEKLIDKGAMVYTSRDDDYDLSDNYSKNRKAKDLKRRVELINEIKPHLFISIHLNTFPSESVKGGQIFHQENDDSKSFAQILQEGFNELSNEDKKAKYGDYYLLNHSNSVGVIVECGFLTNYEDLKNLTQKEYQEKISLTIVESIYLYFVSQV